MIDSSVKRMIFVALLAILAVIWGYNAYQLVPSGEGEYFRSANHTSSSFDSNKPDLNKSIPSIDYEDDPFKPFFTKRKSKPIRSVAKAVENVVPPEMHYLGLVQDNDQKRAIIATGKSNTEIVEINDSVFDMRILSINDEFVKFKYKGKVFTVALGQ